MHSYYRNLIPILEIDKNLPWAYHGGNWNNGILSGSFASGHNTGLVNNNNGSRLVDRVL